uniref:NADH-ubiquinone oxidoreductase chain 2 n=1 Tax=Suinzona borowieci TaxID=2856062 RepID=A0A8F5DQM6_9CUCU|nr:NADH dehydrogenase subunit 2 [Suinzona borowieci]
MLNSYKIMFFSSLMLSTLITISAYSWFSMWIGLEINLLSMIPLLKSPSSLYPSEASVKYFITQSMASSILLFAIVMMSNLNEFMPQNSYFFLIMMLNSALLIKIGAAPFHAWFPEVLEGLNWNNSLIMLTWQKIAPMILLSYNLQMMEFLTLIILTSAIVSGILGLNQISLRKIMAYSSINHLAWMIASMLSVKMIWMIYFFIYSLISLNIILMFKFLNIYFLKQMFVTLNSNKIFKLFFMLNFFSLGGLPPFLGFFPKWLVINNLTENNFFILSLILIVFTLFPLFFYLRITFSTLTFSMNEIIIKITNKVNFQIVILNFFSLIGLFVCTSIFNFY